MESRKKASSIEEAEERIRKASEEINFDRLGYDKYYIKGIKKEYSKSDKHHGLNP